MTTIYQPPPAQKQQRLIDKKYRRSFKDQACEVCGAQDGTVVGAHCRINAFIMGGKPDDALIVPLCAECHREEGAAKKDGDNATWWVNKILKPILWQRYLQWEQE